MDLHIHTCASGHATTDTITDIVKKASELSLTTVGISDHGPASPGSARLSYFRSLVHAPTMRLGVRVLYGVEANIMDMEGHLDVPDELLSLLDYAIISMHRPIFTPGTASENTLAYQRAMEHPGVRIIGHCDDSRFPVDYAALVKTAVEHGIWPELNNVSLLPDSYRKDCRVNSTRLLNVCERAGCPIILSSDSHGREHVGNISAALALAGELAFPEELIINGRMQSEELFRTVTCNTPSFCKK